jgi:hypothetical protein
MHRRRRASFVKTTTAAAAGDDDGLGERADAGEKQKALIDTKARSSTRRTVLLTTLMTPTAAAFAATSVAAPTSSPAPAEWGYADSANGPLAWGSLKNPDGALAFPDCGCRACAQSPINLPSKAAPADARVVGLSLPGVRLITRAYWLSSIGVLTAK